MNATRGVWTVRWTAHDGAHGQRAFGTERRARNHAATIAGGGMPVVVTLERVPVSCRHAARRGGLTRGARKVKA
jgi:hypothetical protein